MKFSYSAVWNDTAQMLRSHGSLLLAIAGVFFLLPALLAGYFLPQPTSTSGTDVFGPMIAHYQNNWHLFLLANIVNMIGAIAIYLLLFDQRGRTVGGAIGAALPILPFYLLMSILSGLLIGFGLAIFILPGLYLIGRLGTASAVMIAEGQRSPIGALGGSWQLTRGHGWVVTGLVMIVAAIGYLLTFVVTAIPGLVIVLLAGRDGLGGLLVTLISAAATAVFATVMIVLFAAIYRALRGSASTKGI